MTDQAEAPPGTGFIAKRFHLLQLLERTSSVVSSRNINPLLGNFCVTILAGKIRVAATDMELSVLSESSLFTSLGNGVILLPADKFLPIVRQAEETDVEVRVTQGTAHISAGRYHGNLQLQPSDDYPPLPGAEEIEFITVRRAELAHALDLVKDAACRDGTNPKLMAVNLAGGKVTAASHTRLHQSVLDVPGLAMQIQVGAADELARLLSGSKLEEIGIGETSHLLAFRLGDDVLMAGKQPEDYPDMEARLLRKPSVENTKQLTVGRDDMFAAVGRVRITTDADTAAVGLRLHPASVTVTSRDKWDNGAEEEIPATWDGNERLVVVNWRHFTDLLALASSPTVTLWFGADNGKRRSPIVLKDPSGASGVIGQLAPGMIKEK